MIAIAAAVIRTATTMIITANESRSRGARRNDRTRCGFLTSITITKETITPVPIIPPRPDYPDLRNRGDVKAAQFC